MLLEGPEVAEHPTPVLKESQGKPQEFLPPEDFVAAGDDSVHCCPTGGGPLGEN